MTKRLLSIFSLMSCCLFFSNCSYNHPSDVFKPENKILVFSKTAGFRHASIEVGVAALQKLGADNNIVVVATENADYFTEDSLRQFAAVVFLNTTGDVLDFKQQADFERYIQAGGGYMGIHSASDTEYNWEWYGKMVGAYFDSHPKIQDANLVVTDPNHASCKHLPNPWKLTHEWYNFKNISEDINVIMKIDESSYEGGKNGDNHPMAWWHEYDGGRAFYTALGHTMEGFSDENLLKHCWEGILYAMGKDRKLDYRKAKSHRLPDEARFAKVVLDDFLEEPMELDILPDGKIIFTERKGNVKLYDPALQDSKIINHLDVHTEQEDGLQGIALDPNFSENHWLYLYYSPKGEEPVNLLSRFEFVDGKIDLESEIVLLEVKVQRDECCHVGGSVEFDTHGNLFLSTGDNTNPFESNGFSPSDGRPGRAPFDARGSSANSQDLRGKILRITPQADGTYTIPDGNLFPKDGSKGRPEIYVMGCRNPFRISIDSRTDYLYWGEVGPDAGEDGENRGPRGHDEINQARKAGFFGWPLFVGDNKAYYRYDFATKTSGEKNDAENPLNDSPNNTGIQNLPPAQKAFIWYPYAKSKEFPLVGKGGRNAMAGPVYHAENYTGEYKIPDYYDGKLFAYDWMRGWINPVTMNAEGDYKGMETFMPNTEFNNIMDMLIAKDGRIYLLEYGSLWFSKNEDARLVRIDYHRGNIPPKAVIEVDKKTGGVPLTVQFSSAKSKDADGDELTFAWKFDSESQFQSFEANPQFTFQKAGVYRPLLKVTDSKGNTALARTEIKVGNDSPSLEWQIAGNRTFYWDNRPIQYQIKIEDAEDEVIDGKRLVVNFDFLKEGTDKTEIAKGHQKASGAVLAQQLIEANNCLSCHNVEKQSVGPSYKMVGKRYKDMKGRQMYLSEKIIKGGNGAWGEQVMSANPALSLDEALTIADYILGLANQEGEKAPTPLQGTYTAKKHLEKGENGTYYFNASYTDVAVDGIACNTVFETLMLRHPKIQAESYDSTNIALPNRDPWKSYQSVQRLRNGAFICFKDIDLTDVKELKLNLMVDKNDVDGGRVELHLGSADGPLLGNVVVNVKEGTELETLAMPIEVPADTSMGDLFFVFRNEGSQRDITRLDWVEFEL
ncbi:MAG: ThuA domain-containing protein [Chitinophagales bacterium]